MANNKRDDSWLLWPIAAIFLATAAYIVVTAPVPETLTCARVLGRAADHPRGAQEPGYTCEYTKDPRFGEPVVRELTPADFGYTRFVSHNSKRSGRAEGGIEITTAAGEELELLRGLRDEALENSKHLDAFIEPTGPASISLETTPFWSWVVFPIVLSLMAIGLVVARLLGVFTRPDDR